MLRDNNSPIPGASIVVIGTSRSTTTNANGAFQIQADRGQVLRVSFIGTRAGYYWSYRHGNSPTI